MCYFCGDKAEDMKKALLFLFVMMCLGASAQSMSGSRWYDYDRNSYFGVRLGGSWTQMFTNIDNSTMSGRIGWHAGVAYGKQLGRGVPLFFETGLYFTQKCTRATFLRTAQTEAEEHDLTLDYIEVPLLFKYKISTGVDDLSVQPFVGGFVAVGVAGKDHSYADRENYKVFSGRGFKRFDGGLKVGCGLGYQNFYFEVSYDIGLANILDGNDSNRMYDYDAFEDRIRTGCLCASVGLEF